MAKYIIEGGHKLSGRVKISGNKNSVFPCLAAALLTEEEVILDNFPDIVDSRVCAQILNEIGVDFSWKGESVAVKAGKIKSSVISKELTQKLRGSILFVGALVGRMGEADFYHPGGDAIGKRSIDTHLEGFRKLGYYYHKDDQHCFVKVKKSMAKKREVFLEEASPTATENLILCSVLHPGVTTIRNCAKEPHVIDLCQMLSLMGAKIEGLGQSTIKISGVKKLSGAQFRLGADYLEIGTYAIAAAITGGTIEIEGADLAELEPVTIHLENMGLRFSQLKGDVVKVLAAGLGSTDRLVVNTWPGYPTDMMSATIVLATQCKGVSLLHDWMYESRMFFVDKLILMGANITIADPHRVLVYGPTKLYGRILESPDIRAGMALVLAALVAQGESVINRAELIERGYENVVEKLTQLGGKIQRVE